MSETTIDSGPSAGALLRRAREATGLHVVSLAASLKVPVRKLEALEADRWDELPDAVFARALALSVCRTLKVDPQPILDRLPQGLAPRLVPEREAINAPFRAPGDARAPNWVDHLTRPVFLAVFALLLGALVLILLPNLRREEALAGGVDPVPAAAEPAAMEVAGAAAPQSGALAVAAATQPAPAASAASAVLAPAPAQAASQATAPVASDLLVFRTQGPSWIEVIDAKGAVALRRLMAAGESAAATGILPLAVTVGSANATSVQLRGKPYDLGPVSRDNVARFEIK